MYLRRVRLRRVRLCLRVRLRSRRREEEEERDGLGEKREGVGEKREKVGGAGEMAQKQRSLLALRGCGRRRCLSLSSTTSCAKSPKRRRQISQRR